MRVGSLFAGIGGFDLAAERAGMEVAWQSEIDRHASAVLDHHWPEVPNYGDIHDIQVAGIGGQRSVVAREGSVLDRGSTRNRTDPRGKSDVSRVPPGGGSDADRIPAVDVLTGGFPCQDYSVAGNRGGLAGDRGALWWEYHRLIIELRPSWVVGENVPGLLSSRDGRDFATIVGSLTECGYGVAWAVLDAQYFGVAQRRRRLFIVGHSGGEPRPEILALGEGLFGHPAPRRETREDVAGTLAPSSQQGRNRSTDLDGNGAYIPVSVGPLTTHMQSPRGTETTDSDHVLAFNWPSGGDTRLSARTSHTDALHAGQVPAVAFAQNQRDEIRDLGDRAGALAAEAGMKQQTYVLQGSMLGRNPNAGPNGKGYADAATAPGYTLDIASGTQGIANHASVRRLTPLECERLQGFPDGWTDIPGNSDTQRYRQLGNAVAVPVVEWIMHRIRAAVLRNPGSALEESEQHPDDKSD